MGFFATYRNKILAVFAAILMAMFTLQSSFSSKGGGGGPDPVRATLNGKNIHVSDWKAAHDEYEYLARDVHIKGNPDPNATLGHVLDQRLFGQMQQHQDIYFLLLQETQRLGIHVPQDKLNNVLQNEIDVPSDLTLDGETQLRQAVAHFLAIDAEFKNALGIIKVSQPLREQALAQYFQNIKVKITEYNAAEFKQLVPAPTTQQVQDQFTTYGNRDAQTPDPRNPFGFGYRVPNRVKFQWIELRRADIVQAAKATHSDYDWDVAAQKYYRMNPQEFPSTAPALQPIVAANSGARPFAEVHQQILDKLQNAEADHLESAILAKMNSTMNADYAEYKSNPTAPPTPALGAPFADYAYLEKLAAAIQTEFKILPAVVSMGDFKNEQQIAETAIGKATINSTDAATYLTTQIEPLVDPDQKSRSLKLLQPSPSIRDSAGNVYIARVIDAQAARMPAAITDVSAQIDNDLRTAAAMNTARESAVRLAGAAQQNGLDKAASLAGRKVISAGPYGISQMDIPGYPLPSDSAQHFVRATIAQLLQTDAGGHAHAVTLVELPRIGKIDVVELDEAIPQFDPNDKVRMAMMAAELDNDITRTYASDFLQKWFDYDQIADRMNYKLDETGMKVGKKPAPGGEPPAQPSPF